MKFIIIDNKTKKALYGVNNKTLKFSTYGIAEEVATQFFNTLEDFTIVNITI